jgi:hypothetical protein
MTPDKEHSAPFTASDIQRYHSGQMSPQEMHLLEKAALDDPFLADALEGYAFTTTPVQDMTEIRERLKQRAGTPRTIPLFTRYPWLRAAAIIIFIVGAGWLAWQISFSPKGEIAIQPPTSQEKAQQSNPSSETKAPGTDSVTTPLPTATEQDARETVTANNGQTSPFTPARTPSVTHSRTRPVQSAPSYDYPQPVEQEDMAALKKETHKDEAASNKYDPAYRQRNVQSNESGPSQQPVNFYNGRVVDAQSNAIPFATISNARDRNMVVTDKNGFFTLKSSDTTLDATVSAAGYEANRLQLENSRTNTVVLKEDKAALEEVVVTSAYGNQKKKETMQTRKVVDTLEPAEGWAYFDDYIARSLEARADRQLESISGEVKLSFEVNRNGEPVNIRVEKSLCPRCDEEAIRLLKEGPKWKKKKNKKGKVTIRF